MEINKIDSSSNNQVMEWNRTFKHFGEVSEGEMVAFTFEYYGDKEYGTHKASCGCITSAWKDNKLTMSFKVGAVPSIAKKNGQFHSESSKILTVSFKDGTTQNLTVRAVVIAKEYETKEVVAG